MYQNLQQWLKYNAQKKTAEILVTVYRTDFVSGTDTKQWTLNFLNRRPLILF